MGDNRHSGYVDEALQYLDEHSTECREHAHDDRCDIHKYLIPLPEPISDLGSRGKQPRKGTPVPPDQQHLVCCGLMVEHMEADDYDEYCISSDEENVDSDW